MKRRQAIVNIAIRGLVVCALTPYAADADADAPPGRYRVSRERGTAYDTVTHLEWSLSTVGSFSAGELAPACASFRTSENFVVPTRSQLMTLLIPSERNGTSGVATATPMFDHTIFSGPGNGEMRLDYWTRTPFIGDPSHFMVVSFGLGEVYDDGPARMHWLRCVRVLPASEQP